MALPMDSRVSSGLAPPRISPVPLARLFDHLHGSAPKGLLEALQPVIQANYFANLAKVAHDLLQAAENDLTYGSLRGELLNKDELAALQLYTMEEPVRFYADLNAACYNPDRSKAKVYRDYMWLLLHALRRLPPVSERTAIFRGVKQDLSANYPVGRRVVWHGPSSCTKQLEVLEQDQFLGKDGDRTCFCITLGREHQARDISKYSLLPEGEVLLPPGCAFEVQSCASLAPRLTMVHLVQMPSAALVLDLGEAGGPADSCGPSRARNPANVQYLPENLTLGGLFAAMFGGISHFWDKADV